MAIAVRPDDNRRTSPLDINAEEYYLKTLRPFMQETLVKYNTDYELQRTLRKIINSTDSKLIENQFDEIIEDITPTLKVLGGGNYYITGPLRKATEEEKKQVRQLKEKLDDFMLILRAEERITPDPPQYKDRLNYDSEKKENIDYGTHNIDVLSQPIETEKIPNLNSTY